jgi:DNA polymerase III delta subunit
MDIRELKSKIECGTLEDDLLIFIYQDSDFLVRQYVKTISANKKLPLEYVEEESELISSMESNIFGMEENNTLKVFRGETITIDDIRLLREKNKIIIVKKLNDQLKKLYDRQIVTFPKLEEWQIRDYMYSILPGLDRKYIDWLIKNTNGDIYRLQNEADKLLVFDENEREILFLKMVDDDSFSDITSNTIFNFTNAITNRKIDEVKHIYSEIENIDIEPVGLVTVLHNNFKDILNVQMTTGATATSLGMNPKKFNAIKYNSGKYSAQELRDIFRMVSSIDSRLKTGEMPVSMIIDYMMINILGR